MATGDVTATINPDGWTANISVAGFTSGATYAFGYSGANIPGASTPYFTVVSKGFDNTGAATTISRTVYVTTNVDVPYSTATIPGTVFSGTLLDGETVTASISGRTAIVVGNQGSGALLRVRTVSGATNAADVWTGGTSGKTFTATGTHTVLTLPKHDELVPTAGLVARVALSDYIYIKDNTGAGNSGTAPTFTAPAGFVVNTSGLGESSNVATAIAVTQSSTQAYPAVIMRTLTLPYKLIGAGTFTTEVQAFHRHAQNGKPVACVICTYTDGTVTRAQTATAMSLSTDADQLPVYAFPDTGSNFTQSANMVANYVAYPWVGDAALDSSANAWQNTGMKLSNLPVGVCDKGGTYGRTYCAVGAGGSDSNTAAYTSQAAAEAGLKTATIGGAAANIKAYNNANYGRNTVDAGVILIDGAGYVFGDGTGGGVHSACSLTITRDSSTTRANAKITGSSGGKFVSTITRLYDMSIISSSVANQLICFTPDASPLICEDMTITGSGGSTKLTSSNTNGKNSVMYKNVTQTGYTIGMANGNDNASLLARSCSVSDSTGGTFSGTRAVVGCTLIDNAPGARFWILAAVAWTEFGNVIISYNKAYSHTQDFFTNSSTQDTTDFALICNLDERIGGTGTVITEVSAANITNNLFWHNTFAGERSNTEPDTAGKVNKAYTLNSYKFNSFYYNGTHAPADVNYTSGGLTGQWPYGQFDVGWEGNNFETNPAGVINFLGIKSTNTTTAGYTNDASVNGTNAGNGNYVPTVASVLVGKIRSGSAVLPYDLLGVAILNDGTGSAGAFQRAAANPTTGIKAPEWSLGARINTYGHKLASGGFGPF